MLDVGTGGGVPGLVMALLRPDLVVELCESTQKKAAATRAMIDDLELPAAIHACRAEEGLQVSTYGTLVARAVAPLAKVLTWLAPHWDAFDQLLVVKGRKWVEERSAARHAGLLSDLQLRKAASYVTPPIGQESVILRVWRERADE